jgi:hypothetical protein
MQHPTETIMRYPQRACNIFLGVFSCGLRVKAGAGEKWDRHGRDTDEVDGVDVVDSLQNTEDCGVKQKR